MSTVNSVRRQEIDIFFESSRRLAEGAVEPAEISKLFNSVPLATLLHIQTPLLLRRGVIRCLNEYFMSLKSTSIPDRVGLFSPTPELYALLLENLKSALQIKERKFLVPAQKLIAAALWSLEGMLNFSSLYPMEELPLEEILAVVLFGIQTGCEATQKTTHGACNVGENSTEKPPRDVQEHTENVQEFNLRLYPDPLWKDHQTFKDENLAEAQTLQLVPLPRKNRKKRNKEDTTKPQKSTSQTLPPLVNPYTQGSGSSESEWSENEGVRRETRTTQPECSLNEQIRWASCDLLSAIVKAAKGRRFFSFWTSFLPSSAGNVSFLGSLRNQQYTKVRKKYNVAKIGLLGRIVDLCRINKV